MWCMVCIQTWIYPSDGGQTAGAHLCSIELQVWDRWNAPSFRVYWPVGSISDFNIPLNPSGEVVGFCFLVFFQSMWFSLLQWSKMTDFKFSSSALCLVAQVSTPGVSFMHSFRCSVFVHSTLSPMYVLWQDRYGISYITSHFLSGSILSLGCIRICRSFVCGLVGVLIWCLLIKRPYIPPPGGWKDLLPPVGSHLSTSQVGDPSLDVHRRSQQHHVTPLGKTADTAVRTVK